MDNLKIKTQYTDKLIKQYVHFHYKKIITFVSICGAIIVLSGILLLLDSILKGIVSILLGVFFLCYGLIIQVSVINANKKLLNIIYEIEFKEDKLVTNDYVNDEKISSGEIKYSALEKIVQDANNIYIYTTKINALIIEKSKLNEKEINFILNIKPKLEK